MAKKKKTQKKFTNLIIIDASGSMTSKASEVIGGLKSLFQDIRNDAQKNPDVLSRTLVVEFSSAGDFRVIVDSTDPLDLKDSVAESYKTRGMTALFDAIGKSFNMILENQDGVFVNILTDVEENDSKEFSSESVKKIIEEAKNKKWALTFMGTREEDVVAAVRLGFPKGNTAVFDNTPLGIKLSASLRGSARSAYYSSTISTSDTVNLDIDNLLKKDDAGSKS